MDEKDKEVGFEEGREEGVDLVVTSGESKPKSNRRSFGTEKKITFAEIMEEKEKETKEKEKDKEVAFEEEGEEGMDLVVTSGEGKSKSNRRSLGFEKKITFSSLLFSSLLFSSLLFSSLLFSFSSLLFSSLLFSSLSLLTLPQRTHKRTPSEGGLLLLRK